MKKLLNTVNRLHKNSVVFVRFQQSGPSPAVRRAMHVTFLSCRWCSETVGSGYRKHSREIALYLRALMKIAKPPELYGCYYLSFVTGQLHSRKRANAEMEQARHYPVIAREAIEYSVKLVSNSEEPFDGIL